MPETARRPGRNKSAMSREIQRGGERCKAEGAQGKYCHRRKNCRRRLLYENGSIRDCVCEKLTLRRSPEQISGRARLEKRLMPSFSSIYRWLNLGLLPRAVELKARLRRFRKRKKPRKTANRADARSIAARAKEVFRRERFGDWEIDMEFRGFRRNSPCDFIRHVSEPAMPAERQRAKKPLLRACFAEKHQARRGHAGAHAGFWRRPPAAGNRGQ
jgi:IS30 family transposase